MSIRSTLVFLLILISVQTLKSQEAFLIGLVLKSDSLALPGANVVLTSQETQAKQGAITSERGRFRFKGLTPGIYTLNVDFVGYEGFNKELNLKEGPNFAGRIILGEKSYELNQVVIKGQVPPAQQKGDTTEYNSDAFKTNPDATAENLLEKMPGVVVQNGQVQAQGEQVRQVLVDGKPFFGNDPQAALKNLPAEVIQKIQVFDQQSEQAQQTGFDDGETTKTINIVTKPTMRNGTFGRLFGGIGAENEDQIRYNSGGNVNIFEKNRRISVLGQFNNINQQNFASEDLLGVVSANSSQRRGFGGGRRGGRGGRGGGDVSDFLVNEQGGISATNAFGLNYTDNWGKKIEVAGSYFFNQTDNNNETFLRQEYISNGETGQIYEEDEQSNSTNINHRANLRMEIKLSDKTSIIYRPRLTIQQNTGASNSTATTDLASQPISESQSDFNSELFAISASNFLVFRHRFEKRGRSLSVAARADYTAQSGDNQLTSNLSFFTEPASTDLLDQQGQLSNSGWNLNANVRYSEPIGKIGFMQLYYRVGPQINDSDRKTFTRPDGSTEYTLLDTSLTNVFNSQYLTNEGGVGLFIRAKKLFMIGRVGYQNANLQNDRTFPTVENVERNFNNLVPFFLLRYRSGKATDLRVIYRGSTTAPTVEQLQDVIDNSNPLQVSSGNPALDQSYSHRVIVRYNRTDTKKNRVLIVFLNGQAQENYIGQHTIRVNRDTTLAGGYELPTGSQYSFPVNLNGYFVGRAFVSTGKLIDALKLNVNVDASLDYRRQPGLINNVLNYSNTTTLGFGLVLSSNISENVDFTLSSRTTANQVINSVQSSQNTNFLQQNSMGRVNFIFGPKIVFRSTVTHQLYSGLSDSFNQNFWLWSLALGKKFGKNDQAELQLSMFDALRQNTSIQRTVTENYIEDLQTLVLQRYLMLTFTYNIKNFKDGMDRVKDR